MRKLKGLNASLKSTHERKRQIVSIELALFNVRSCSCYVVFYLISI
jgi:hypothetical protein